ncbi:hypothetical protein [Streptomyces luteolus]|uniref:Uncharacterized protein n=1 Tax=Streptomyces luteolus TaxID=3043615 RepID=A0ABT6SQY8_9ACTN|nr:hypothetical protein [Streptomyces sp. B-S-A12]MDI3417811.1 hypothetical protein [Streptomyces sp. B-S-A12]
MEALTVRWVLEQPAIPRELLIEELAALGTDDVGGTRAARRRAAWPRPPH